METVRFKVIVFDFDGTLVDTASAKRQAFFETLPEQCHTAVESVLRANPDGSRHSVIPAMLEESCRRGADVQELDSETAIAAYSDAVENAVKTASDIEGVHDVLEWANGQAPVYIFSMTPEKELSDAIGRRDWREHISESFGHPSVKQDVLARLLERHGAQPEEVLVVGDGQSDRDAAAACGCYFYRISPDHPLTGVMSIGGAK